jgi:hypothetical protein
MPDQPTDAAQIQALLHELSRVRLAVSADLSGAAGALDDNRPDVASDMVAGARRELAELLDPAREKYHPKALVSARGASDDESPMEAPERNGRSPRHRLGRALAGAAALAVAIAVVPQMTRGSSHPSTGATAAAPSPSMELASSQFAMLSERLAAADASPAAILAAGRSWQAAISRNLPAVAGQAEVASTAVTMLRLERTLLQVSPTLRAPQNRTVAVTLAAASDRLLRQLRSLADPQVLAILPAAIQALPLSPSKPTVPVTGATPAPTTAPAVASGTSAQPPGGPQAAPTNPAAPQAPTQPTSAPSLGSGLPVPQLPLPSALGQLTGGGTQGDGLSQTVGQVLSGLGLGG